MTEPGEEKEYKTTDPIGEVNSTNRPEQLTVEVDPSDSKKTTLENIVKTRPLLEHSKSYATTTSVVSGVTESSIEVKQKPWYKNLNPMKWGAPPPVPQVRQVSREYTASFLSLMYFQWMSPLMTVCYYSP
jgi:ATP-binding cassette, subfamily C (CFTR/MRP), member 1